MSVSLKYCEYLKSTGIKSFAIDVISEVKLSPLDDDTERKLPTQSPQNKMSNLEF